MITRILIVDDESLARARLRQLIESMDGYEVAAEAPDGKKAIELIAAGNIDVVLLDIRMPGMSGLEVGRHLCCLTEAPAIIFTTAYNEYALEAFESHAVDYLMKPIRKEKLQDALKAARRLSRLQLQEINQEDDDGRRSHICARVRGDLKLIDLYDIYYFRADSKYVEVRHRHGTTLIEESLISLEKEFENEFLRVHRNALVAPAYIEGLKKDENGHAYLYMKDIEDTIEVSRRHLPGVRALLKG